YEGAAAVRKTLVRDVPDVVKHRLELAETLFDLATVLVEDHQFSEAEDYFRQAQAEYQALLGRSESAQVAECHSRIGIMLDNWAEAYRARKEPAKARPLLEQAITHQQAALDADCQIRVYRERLRAITSTSPALSRR